MLREKFLNEDVEVGAEKYYKDYRPYMEALEKHSPLSQVRKVNMYDVVALGSQLKQFENYRQYVNEAGTTADLGKLPDLAFDIITASYGNSIVPLLASIQPIEEEQGTVYFKQTKTATARGTLFNAGSSSSISGGEILRNPLAAPAGYAVGYAGEMVNVSASLLATATTATGTLTQTTVRPRSVAITLTYTTAGTVIRAFDDGEGNILGVGIYGTINYTSGAYSLNFTTAIPAGGATLAIDYGTDFEDSGVIPKITTVTASTAVKAEVFVLGAEVGLFKAYNMKKRFGKVAEDEIVQDLSSEITAEIGNTLIRRLYLAAQGNTTWSRTPSAGVSWAEHKLEFFDIVSNTENVIINNAGRGVLNVIVAGTGVCALFQNMANFQRSNITSNGPHVFGIYNGNIVVVRAPMLPALEALCIYKGTGMFDAPIVYAPYMPLFVTNTMPVPNNVLKTQGVAAVWSGMKVVIPSFVTKLTLT